MAVEKWLLRKGNGHQAANRRKALSFVEANLAGLTVIDEKTVEFPPFGVCHFSAYTDQLGAMISTPDKDDNSFGSASWHARGRIMMFHDFGDGRVGVFVCPIKQLFEHRTIGHHGVKWPDVIKLAEFKQVFRPG